jgi:hypothetical protein
MLVRAPQMLCPLMRPAGCGQRTGARHVAKWRQFVLAALLPLLLASQLLGLVHRVLHGAVPVEPGVGAAALHAVADHSGADHAGHDTGSVSCRLFDQLACGDAAFGALADASPGTRRDAWDAPAPTGHTPVASHRYRARGPPTA